MARKRKWKKYVFSPFICVRHLNLSISLQIRPKTSKETKVFHIVIRVPPRGSFRKGWGCEVFSTRVNVFFLPYFKLRTIFSGYGMILKRENNFSDRVNDPVSMGKKSSYVNTYGFWVQNGPEAKVKKSCIFTIYMCKTLKLERFLTDSSKNVERNKGFSRRHSGAFTRVFS